MWSTIFARKYQASETPEQSKNQNLFLLQSSNNKMSRLNIQEQHCSQSGQLLGKWIDTEDQIQMSSIQFYVCSTTSQQESSHDT